GILNERRLAEGVAIPPGARVLFWPLPYCPSDAAYQRILSWVRAGGVLYLSGDVSYDEQRRRTREERLQELCGVRFLGERYPNIDYGKQPPAPISGREGWRFSPGYPGLRLAPAGARVIGTAPGGLPVAFLHQTGKGRVFFLADPLELHTGPRTRAVDAGVYARVLRLAGVTPLRLLPDDPFLHLFRVPLEDGGSAWVVFNADESRDTRDATLSIGGERLTLTMATHRPGLAWVDGTGRLRAVEASRGVRLGRRVLLGCSDQTILFSTDGSDLRQSQALAAVTMAPGVLKVGAGVWSSPAAQAGEATAMAETPLPPQDMRAATVRDRDTPCELARYRTKAEWQARAGALRRQILASAGLLPLPEKTPLQARITGRVVRDGYTVEKVCFQSWPGFYVVGNLYRPLGGTPPYPAVLCPHGHWKEGRLGNSDENSVPGRAISLARLGFVAFTYSMVGYNDSRAVPHQELGERREQMWGVSLMGLQLWNSIRALDFLCSLPQVDKRRLACTGESGGGTQTFLL
ncbi:MAG: hypothetical protein QHJ73_18155, partial [Armatimonadota bacterium]|nr:hypothetical protein [Armatimonadota bacterium]